jgi:hypothetical protein
MKEAKEEGNKRGWRVGRRRKEGRMEKRKECWNERER